MKDKMKNYILKHKIRLAILTTLLFGALIFAFISNNKTYNYVIEMYEENPRDIQTCEDGIYALSKMKYYRNSKNYIRQMKKSIIEAYCSRHYFDDAKNYLDRNYEESLEDMYAYIEDAREEYEEAERIREHDSIEGRTERVRQMYYQMGVGGCDTEDLVIDTLLGDLRKKDFNDLQYIFPVWNRNETYFNMFKKDLMQFVYDSITDENYYWVDSFKIEYDSMYSTSNYKTYLRNTYDIDIEVQDLIQVSYNSCVQDSISSSIQMRNNMIFFKTENKWFFGGVISTNHTNPNEIIPADSTYKGEIID